MFNNKSILIAGGTSFFVEDSLAMAEECLAC